MEKKPSMRLSQEPCLGVKVNSKRYAGCSMEITGLEARTTVDVHADDAAISVNFWLTPNEANLNPDGSGLAVCRVPPLVAWETRGYNAYENRIVAFLGQHVAEVLILPYSGTGPACSSPHLFHHSNATELTIAYEKRRVNLPFLFDRHEN